ncbi:phosphatidylserine decarboxylase [Flavobacteriaceae bacterium R38]|nr:phosphatidylserine decarboxylase [Flavobacteriaceae bacterium R38]
MDIKTITSSEGIIEALINELKNNDSLKKLLITSLVQADKKAKNDLDNALYRALDWPIDIDGYIRYLKGFARWTPQQSGDDAWLKPGTHHHQEVYDRLCHFYWLIDQEIGIGKTTIIENIPFFKEWLIAYAQLWGSFLNTTESFNDEILKSFQKYAPQYKVEDSMINGKPNNPSGWLTFNQFFARELNPGLRPIDSPDNNLVVTSPADCTFKAIYQINENSELPDIPIKKTHKFASIVDLLEGSNYKNHFANGTFVHYFLGPYSYHRFHAPIAGVVKECYPIHGLVYLDVHINKNQFDAPDSSEDAYEFAQARGIITIDTTDSPYGNIGVVTIIPVGMCQVSSVNMTATVGQNLLKGDEFGYFLFGGSDIIVLFQDGIDPQISEATNYRLYGTKIADCQPFKGK